MVLQGYAQKSVPVLLGTTNVEQFTSSGSDRGGLLPALSSPSSAMCTNSRILVGRSPETFEGRGLATFNPFQASESTEPFRFAGHSLPSAEDSLSMTVE